MAVDSYGNRGQPQFSAQGGMEAGADETTLADYSSAVGTRRVGTIAERNALSGNALFVDLIFNADGTDYIRTSNGWVRHNFGRLGSNRVTTRITVPGNAWGDLLVVTASSSGALCVADWKVQFANANSGATRVLSFRLLVDGVQVGSDIGYDVPLSSGLIGYSAAFDFESSPVAGSHVWRLQGNASTASAVYVNQAVLTVTEQ